jgi:ABC-type branched-subunit amino acid transport system substrate-binding protein
VILLYILIIILLFSLTACSPNSTPRIALVGNLSGPHSDLGTNMYKGAIQAFNELKTISHLYEIVPIDIANQSSIEALSEAINNADADCIMGIESSTTMIELLPLLNEMQIPVFTSTASTNVLCNQDDLIFRLTNPISKMIEKTVEFCINSNLDKTLILSDILNPEFSIENIEQFSTFIDPLATLPINAHEMDHKRISDLLNQYPELDSILIISPPIHAGLITQQLRMAGCTVPIILTTWSLSDLLLQYIGNDAENVFIVSDSYSVDSAVYASFFESFQEQYHTKPNYGAYFGYEIAYFIDHMNSKTGLEDTDNLKNAIHALELYEGCFSNYTFNNRGDGSNPPEILQLIEGDLLEVTSVE